MKGNSLGAKLQLKKEHTKQLRNVKLQANITINKLRDVGTWGPPKILGKKTPKKKLGGKKKIFFFFGF